MYHVAMAIVQRPLRADAARNRARLLAAAREVFAERGLDATMDEVARRAGVGVGTAYRRFRNRDDLIAALFEERLDDFMAIIDESLADPDPWRGVACFLERSMEMQAEDRGFRDLLLQSAEGRERMRRFRARIRPLVGELVRRAREAGVLRADLVEDDVLLVSLMTGAVADFAHGVDPQLWRRALGLLLDGLRARGASPLPVGPLDVDSADRAMAAMRPGRR
jgi:AcrR family transcriptional regulator